MCQSRQPWALGWGHMHSQWGCRHRAFAPAELLIRPLCPSSGGFARLGASTHLEVIADTPGFVKLFSSLTAFDVAVSGPGPAAPAPPGSLMHIHVLRPRPRCPLALLEWQWEERGEIIFIIKVSLNIFLHY